MPLPVGDGKTSKIAITARQIALFQGRNLLNF